MPCLPCSPYVSPSLSHALPLSLLPIKDTQSRTYSLFENFMEQDPKSGPYCLKIIELHSWKEALKILYVKILHTHVYILMRVCVFS